ncbi:protein of unknown function [Haloechinothrix alba]|uniref:TLP18.3, Psb32 and MOLO-1 founding protein of phosphatase n=1 Tax=Haloechinothrix alba TaxID=664784 RepID=A0A238XMV7_9PSEU|nr:DUF5130 family protein [Haloechinothrix alba]SNR60012.1 protein of unknown function [Haloechinothrix alba]
MALGELARPAEAVSETELQEGSVVTASGRVSVAREYQQTTPSGPFKPWQLARIDEALTLSSRDTGLDFSVYLGELGEDSRAGAERLFDRIGEREHASVLIAISPGERVVEIVTGETATSRLSQRALKLAVMSMVASFKEGDLCRGIVTGLRMLADQAGRVGS